MEGSLPDLSGSLVTHFSGVSRSGHRYRRAWTNDGAIEDCGSNKHMAPLHAMPHRFAEDMSDYNGAASPRGTIHTDLFVQDGLGENADTVAQHLALDGRARMGMPASREYAAATLPETIGGWPSRGSASRQ